MASINDTLILGGAKSFTDALDKLGVGYQLYDNPGISSSGDRDWLGSPVSGAQVPVWDGQRFKLMQGDEMLYEGDGIDALRQATAMTGDLGKGWRIISNAPTGTDEAAQNALFDSDGSFGIDYGGQRRSDFGDFLPYALLAAAPFGLTAGLGALGAGAASAGGGATGAAGVGAGAGAAGAAGGAGLGAGLGAAALPAFEGITVLGSTGAGLGLGGAAGLAGLGGAAALGASGALGGGGAAGAAPGTLDPNTITVTGAPPPVQNLNLLGGVIDPAALAVAGGLPLTGATPPVTQSPQAPPKSTVDKIVDYLQLGSLGTGLLGNLFGGGAGGNGTVPGGLGGGLAPVFTGGLPAPNLPGTAAGTTGARTMPEQDWYRYAMRPEQSFFNAVPQGYTPPKAELALNGGSIIPSDPQWDRDLSVTRT